MQNGIQKVDLAINIGAKESGMVGMSSWLVEGEFNSKGETTHYER